MTALLHVFWPIAHFQRQLGLIVAVAKIVRQLSDGPAEPGSGAVRSCCLCGSRVIGKGENHGAFAFPQFSPIDSSQAHFRAIAVGSGAIAAPAAAPEQVRGSLLQAVSKEQGGGCRQGEEEPRS